jgi:hypothetical protein
MSTLCEDLHAFPFIIPVKLGKYLSIEKCFDRSIDKTNTHIVIYIKNIITFFEIIA